MTWSWRRFYPPWFWRPWPGRGRGWHHWLWLCYMTPYWAYPPAYTAEEERRFELHKEELGKELRAVEERLKELEKTEKQTA